MSLTKYRFLKQAIYAICLVLSSICVLSGTQAHAQSVTVSAPATVNIPPEDSTSTYSASVSVTGPQLNSEQEILSGPTYLWSTGATGASTTVTVSSSSSDYTSTVSCTVSWTIQDSSTNPATISTVSASGSADTTVHTCTWGSWYLSGAVTNPSVTWSCVNDTAVSTCVPGYYTNIRVSSCDSSDQESEQCNLTLTDIGSIEVEIGTVDDHWVEQFQESDTCHGPDDGQILDVEDGLCCDSD
jgi:hypothetical protein